MESCACVGVIGGMPQPPAAVFKSLPPRQILTLNFDAPEMWLVEPVIAEHDLDNLKLEQLGDSPTLSAEYELEALMLTGRCMDLHARRRELVSICFFVVVIGLLYKATPMVASMDLQVLLRLSPYPVRGHWLM